MIYEPTSEQDICEIVRSHRDLSQDAKNQHRDLSQDAKNTHRVSSQDAKTQKKIRIVAGGTKQGVGRPVEAAAQMSLKNLSGVTLYEPGEMVISAKAGTPLREIEEIIAQKNQMLPFEPADWRGLLGSTGEPSIGALAACNISGSRRISHGAARDSLIGVRFVNGRGEAIKSGGRVVKNVTGLDLVKLQAGAWGALGVLTEVTFKLLPRPQTEATLVLHGRDDAAGVKVLSAALGSPFEVSGAAFLPAGLEGAPSRVLLRLENFADSVAYRIGELQKRIGAGDVLNGEESARLWRALRNVAPFCGAEEAVWRVSTAPTKAPEFVAAFTAAQNARAFYDWGGGLVWVACAPTLEAGRALRAALAPFGGHATLIRAPQSLRAALETFQPLPAPLMAAQARVKASLDPDGLFNPGLMYAGL